MTPEQRHITVNVVRELFHIYLGEGLLAYFGKESRLRCDEKTMHQPPRYHLLCCARDARGKVNQIWAKR
jgi:hypothetical protein